MTERNKHFGDKLTNYIIMFVAKTCKTLNRQVPHRQINA